MIVGNRQSGNFVNAVVGLAFVVILMMAMFWVAKSIFRVLAFVAPALLIATLIINYRVVVNYGKWLWRLLRHQLPMGIAMVLLTVIGFPVVSFVLLGKALFLRKLEKLSQGHGDYRADTRYVEYEIVEDDLAGVDDSPPLELPPIERPPQRRSTDYEDFFR